jgi:hypothetical protein
MEPLFLQSIELEPTEVGRLFSITLVSWFKKSNSVIVLKEFRGLLSLDKEFSIKDLL